MCAGELGGHAPATHAACAGLPPLGEGGLPGPVTMQHKEDSDDDGHSVRRAPVSGPRDCWLACRLGAYGGLQLVRVTSCFVGALAQGDEEDETDIKFDADKRMERKLLAMTAKDAEKRVRWVIQVRVAGSQPMCFGGHRSLCRRPLVQNARDCGAGHGDQT